MYTFGNSILNECIFPKSGLRKAWMVPSISVGQEKELELEKILYTVRYLDLKTILTCSLEHVLVDLGWMVF